MISAKTIEARPRGPNQPTYRTVGSRNRLPSRARATGPMRTTRGLRTAEGVVRHGHDGETEDGVERDPPVDGRQRGPEQDRTEHEEAEGGEQVTQFLGQTDH